jgi:hypothetical protein
MKHNQRKELTPEDRASRNRAKRRRNKGLGLPWQVTETNICDEIHTAKTQFRKDQREQRRQKLFIKRMEERGLRIPKEMRDEETEQSPEPVDGETLTDGDESEELAAGEAG